MDLASRFLALRSQTTPSLQDTAAQPTTPSGRPLPHSNLSASPAVLHPTENGDSSIETRPDQDLQDVIDTTTSEAQCALNKLRSLDPQSVAELFKQQPECAMLFNTTGRLHAPASQDPMSEQDLQARVAQLEDMNRHFWHLAHDKITKDHNKDRADTATAFPGPSPSQSDHENQTQYLKKGAITATKKMVDEVRDALRCLKSDAGIDKNQSTEHSSRFKLPFQMTAEIDRLARLIDQVHNEGMEAISAGLRNLRRTNEHFGEDADMNDCDYQGEESENTQEGTALRAFVNDSSQLSSQEGIYRRQAMQLQNVGHELYFKLEDVRKKLQEEVTARKNAERALEQMRDASAKR